MEPSLIMQRLQLTEVQLTTLGRYLEHLLQRDIEYVDKMELLKKSLLKLDPKNRYGYKKALSQVVRIIGLQLSICKP